MVARFSGRFRIAAQQLVNLVGGRGHGFTIERSQPRPLIRFPHREAELRSKPLGPFSELVDHVAESAAAAGAFAAIEFIVVYRGYYALVDRWIDFGYEAAQALACGVE